MGKITIICTVAADFTNREGGLFQVRAKDIGVILEAPEWIKDTLMFKWLLNDGSISFVDRANKAKAENEPLAGIAADGKAEPVETEVVVNEAPKKRTRKKVDAE